MTERKMRHMGRGELIKIILELQRRDEELEQQIAELEARLSEKTVNTDNIGSLVDASAALQAIFLDGQKRADAYLRLAEAGKHSASPDQE